MVRVLVDTCVLADGRRPQGDRQLRSRVAGLDPTRVLLSVVTTGELAKGRTLLPAGPPTRALSSWRVGLARHDHEWLLPIDPEVARLGGELTAREQGMVVPAADGVIAATALRHGLHVRPARLHPLPPRAPPSVTRGTMPNAE